MAGHWTYDTPDRATLFQGDLLSRSDRLKGLLAEVHPYFAEEHKYQYFMLLTQSCDLAIRGGKCKAPYLTIAAVREVTDLLLSKELQNATRGEAIGRVVSESSGDKLRDFLHRLVNNNNPNYFFLRADTSQGLGTDCCACLRVTVPLRVKHYDLLLEAKTGQLQEVFQAKLGWLVGNNYSRVGTPDWSDSKSDLKSLIDGLFLLVHVVEDRRLIRTLKLLKDKGEAPSEDRILELQKDPKTAVPRRSELFERAFESVWSREAGFADLCGVQAALRDPDALAEALKPGLTEVIRDAGCDIDADAVADRLARSNTLHEALGALVGSAWPSPTPPAKRSRFLGRLQNESDFTAALKEP